MELEITKFASAMCEYEPREAIIEARLDLLNRHRRLTPGLTTKNSRVFPIRYSATTQSVLRHQIQAEDWEGLDFLHLYDAQLKAAQRAQRNQPAGIKNTLRGVRFLAIASRFRTRARLRQLLRALIFQFLDIYFAASPSLPAMEFLHFDIQQAVFSNSESNSQVQAKSSAQDSCSS